MKECIHRCVTEGEFNLLRGPLVVIRSYKCALEHGGSLLDERDATASMALNTTRG